MIYSLFSFQFWFFALITPVVFLLTFFIPGWTTLFYGKVLQKSVHLSSVTAILLSTVLGLVMWGIQGYVFGYLHIRWLTYVYLLVIWLLTFQQRKQLLQFWQQLRLELKKAYKPVVIFIVIGTTLQVLPMFGSGLLYSKGAEFFLSNGIDGVMHLAFIQSMTHTFPPQEPGAVGMALQNYHYWSDLVMSELVRVWHLPVSELFFQLMPWLISFLTAAATYLLVKLWKGTRQTGMWALFTLFFASDATYLFMLPLHHKFGFETPAIDNGITQFLNVPHTFAKLVFITGLIPLTYWIQTKKNRWLFLTVVMFMTLVGFKVYFGIFAAFGLSLLLAVRILVTLWEQIKQKRTEALSLQKILFKTWQTHFAEILLIVLFAFVSALIYLPANRASGGLMYAPLEWPKLMLGVDVLDLKWWWLRHQVYEAAHNYRNLAILDLLAIMICLVCVYGTRLIGFINWRERSKEVTWQVYLFLFPGILLFTWLGLYTLQTAGNFNVFNFFAVASVGLSLFAAFWLAKMWQSKNVINKVVVIIFVLITLPRSLYEIISTVQAYASQSSSLLVTNEEMTALAAVRKQAPANVIVQGQFQNVRDRQTPYIAFFTDRPSYLAGDGLMQTRNQPIDDRIRGLKYLFMSPDVNALADRTREKKVSILFMQKLPNQVFPPSYMFEGSQFKTIFSSQNFRAIQIDHF